MAQSVLGIDIAKQTFYAALVDPQGKAQTKLFANRPEGFDSLRTWLTGLMSNSWLSLTLGAAGEQRSVLRSYEYFLCYAAFRLVT